MKDTSDQEASKNNLLKYLLWFVVIAIIPPIVVTMWSNSITERVGEAVMTVCREHTNDFNTCSSLASQVEKEFGSPF